jgi:hypothetical protein
LTKIRQEGTAPPVPIGGLANRAIQPYPEAFAAPGAWSISAPKDALDDVADVFLDIDYQGDVARLFSGTRMLDDDIWYDGVWRIGLKRFKAEIEQPLTHTVMPLRKDAPIFFDDAVKAKLPAAAQVADVLSVKLVPQYVLGIKD